MPATRHSPFSSTTAVAGKLLLFCLAFTAVAIALSCVALARDRAAVKSEIAAAFASGALTTKIYVGPDARRGRYLTNDCFILQTLLHGTGSVLADTVNSTVLAAGEAGACQRLEDSLAPVPAGEPYAYSRYFWGAKAFVGPLLAVASLDTIKSGLRLVVYALLAAALGVAAWGAVRGGRHPRGLYVTAGAIALGLLVLYDLKHFAVTLAHGFSEAVLAGYLLYVVLGPPTRGDDPLPWRWLVLGGLTAWFELLTGPLVMAVAIVMLLENAAMPGLAPQRATRAGAMTGLAVAGCFMALQVAVLAFGDARNVAQFFYHLALRMQLHRLIDIPVEPAWQIAENLRSYHLFDVISALGNELPRLTGDNAEAAAAVFRTSAAGLGFALGIAALRQRQLRQMLVYLLVPLLFATWYLVLANHTVIHAWGMVRLMVLLPICALLAVLHSVLPAAWWESRKC
jgi:hypothetical protein